MLAAVLSIVVLSAAGCGAGAEREKETKLAPAPEGQKHVALPPVTLPVARTVRVPVLTYHRVHRYAAERQPSLPDLTVEPRIFESTLAALERRRFRTVS